MDPELLELRSPAGMVLANDKGVEMPPRTLEMRVIERKVSVGLFKGPWDLARPEAQRSATCGECVFGKISFRLQVAFLRAGPPWTMLAAPRSLTPLHHEEMTMLPQLFAVTALAVGLVGSASMAEQYVVQINGPLAQTSDGLRSALKIDEIDTFTHEGKNYVVVRAPTEGYLSAYFDAAGHTPIAVATLGADWEGVGLDGLTLERRMLFLTPVSCEFCAP